MSQALPLVLLEWVDSSQPLPSWKHLDDIGEMEVHSCVSVGWLVKDGKHVKVLAPNLSCLGEDNAQAMGLVRIPTRAVTRKHVIRDPTQPRRAKS